MIGIRFSLVPSDSALVAITTKDLLGARALRVSIRDRLLCDSFAMADQPRSLDRSHLGDGPLTALNTEELADLEERYAGYWASVLSDWAAAGRSGTATPTGCRPRPP